MRNSTTRKTLLACACACMTAVALSASINKFNGMPTLTPSGDVRVCFQRFSPSGSSLEHVTVYRGSAPAIVKTDRKAYGFSTYDEATDIAAAFTQTLPHQVPCIPVEQQLYTRLISWFSCALNTNNLTQCTNEVTFQQEHHLFSWHETVIGETTGDTAFRQSLITMLDTQLGNNRPWRDDPKHLVYAGDVAVSGASKATVRMIQHVLILLLVWRHIR